MRFLLLILLCVRVFAVKELPEDFYEKAEQHQHISKSLAITTPIPDELRHVWNEELHSVPGTFGMSVLRIYRCSETGAKYLIAGDRFGMNSLKVTIGGQIDESDKTVQEAYERELTEEYFSQLPRDKTNVLEIKSRKTHVTGGVEQTETRWFTNGWGPCIGWIEVESEYKKTDLEKAISIMNENARLHFSVAEYFHALEEKSDQEKQSQAKELLENFKESPGAHIIPLLSEARAYLEGLSKNGSTPIPNDSCKTGFNFAQTYVHTYTEYKSFKLVPLDEWMEFMTYHLKVKEEGQLSEEAAAPVPESLKDADLFQRFDADTKFYALMQEPSFQTLLS